MSPKRYRLLGSSTLALAAAVAIGIFAAMVVLSARDVTSRGRAAAAAHDADAGSPMRILAVGTADSGMMSSRTGPLSASLLSGSIPAEPMMATVLTDENCAPDAQGISHCSNELRLADGRLMTVRHDHRMTDVPCLSPGERVLVTGS